MAPATCLPPFPYYGAKVRIARRIVAEIPAHEHYVEPFAGSLAVLLAKAPAKWETVNDLDDLVVSFWRVLRDRPDELARAVTMTPHARSEHATCLDVEVDDDLERARRVHVMLTQGRSARLRKTGWRNVVKPSSLAPLSTYMRGYAGRILPAAERLRDVQIECRPANEVIEKYGTNESTVLYVDPPYFADRATNYRHEMKGQQEHHDMLDALLACKAAVVLSGYDNDSYASRLAEWRSVNIRATTSQGGARAERIEMLWVNRPAPDNASEPTTGGR